VMSGVDQITIPKGDVPDDQGQLNRSCQASVQATTYFLRSPPPG
jgi:hypothetical protein